MRQSLILQPLHRFTNVTAHSPNIPPLYLRQSSFYNPSVASPTSQLILQPLHRFIYVTAHSPNLPLLHLRHSSFSSPSAALPTSQVILQPFRCFSYVTGTPRKSPGEPPTYRGMKNSVWWTSLLLSLEVATVLDSC